MGKRNFIKTHQDRNPKRQRLHKNDRLSFLSDELLLRTLLFLSIPTLTTCERLSRRFRALACDSQLWKSAYYNRFVRPRASRIPGIRDQEVPTASLLFSSRISKWLEDEHLVRKGRQTNWKRQYKLRHNWSRGSCAVSELEIAQRPSIPGMLVRLRGDIAVTVDTTHGIRAWNIKGDQRLLATLELNINQDPEYKHLQTPTSLALDNSKKNTDDLYISVGFLDGAFGIYMLQKEEQAIYCQHMHASSINGMISAIAYASPYLLTMTDAQLLSLYCFPTESTNNSILDPPRLLSSLKSHTTWPPLSLAIRFSAVSITASIAYSLPTYLSGWSVGLQELRLTSDGTISQSRLASATDQGFTPLNSTLPRPQGPANETQSANRPDNEKNVPSSKPTSLSYSHPYLLASHTDNTLTLYLVSSNEDHLIIGPGTRLWGHTSSVSGAQVGGRGKAVSVSLRGDEIRVWELEGGVSSRSSKQRTGGQASVQIRPEYKPSGQQSMSHRGARACITQQDSASPSSNELAVTKGWIGFDEEKVVVLRERSQGSQALVMYDFS